MTAQKGKDLLIKIADGAGYSTVAGLRSRRLRSMPRPSTSPTLKAPTAGENCSMAPASSAPRCRAGACSRMPRPMR